jgi:hypothetical protein
VADLALRDQVGERAGRLLVGGVGVWPAELLEEQPLLPLSSCPEATRNMASSAWIY